MVQLVAFTEHGRGKKGSALFSTPISGVERLAGELMKYLATIDVFLFNYRIYSINSTI